MGLFDFISDIPVIGDAVSWIGKEVGGLFGLDDIKDTVQDVGSKLLTNQVISQPNSAMSYEQQVKLMQKQYEYNKTMAKESYDRSDVAAAKAYERNAAEALSAWKRSENSALAAFNRSERAATTAYERYKSMFDKHWKDQISAYTSRYQWTMNDMRKAGLNPILAASSGFNVGHSPTASVAQMPMASAPAASAQALGSPRAEAPAGSVGLGHGYQPAFPESGSSALAYSRSKESRAASERIGTEILVNLQKQAEIFERVHLTRAEVTKVSAEERRIVQEILNLKQEVVRKAQDILTNQARVEELNSRKYLNEKDRELKEQMRKTSAMDAKRIHQLAYKIQEETAKIERVADVYRGPSGKIMSYVHEIMQSLGPVAGAIIGFAGGRVGRRGRR